MKYMGKIVGYHRTSTTDQHLDRGIKAIEDYCKANNLELHKIFTDQCTGKNFQRPRYTVMKEDVLVAGDELIIKELDRLGRNKTETLKELQYYKESGIIVRILELPTTLIDFSTFDNNLAKMMMETINNLLLELYATLSHAEMEKREQRQAEGISAKRQRADWAEYGRPRAMQFEVFKKEYAKLLAEGKKPFEIKDALNLNVTTFYRYKKQYEQEKE